MTRIKLLHDAEFKLKKFRRVRILRIILYRIYFSWNIVRDAEEKPCKYEESECIIKLINFYLNDKHQGDSSLNLVAIDPLSVSKIDIKQGAKSPVNIDLEFTNNKVYGIKDANVYKVSGFGKDLTKKHEIRIKFKSVSLVGDYKIGGKVLILPISGNGKSNMTLANFDMIMKFVGTPYVKNGATYMKINNMKLDVKPERLYYHFENLFNGDKALGDSMNTFLNENWKEIFEELHTSITDAFARIFEIVVSTVFTKYPYEKYFADN